MAVSKRSSSAPNFFAVKLRRNLILGPFYVGCHRRNGPITIWTSFRSAHKKRDVENSTDARRQADCYRLKLSESESLTMRGCDNSVQTKI